MYTRIYVYIELKVSAFVIAFGRLKHTGGGGDDWPWVVGRGGKNGKKIRTK